MIIRKLKLTDEMLATLSHKLAERKDIDQAVVYIGFDTQGYRYCPQVHTYVRNKASSATFCCNEVSCGSIFAWGCAYTSAEITAKKHCNNLWLVTVTQDIDTDGKMSDYWTHISTTAKPLDMMVEQSHWPKPHLTTIW